MIIDNFKATHLSTSLEINDIMTVHYFEYPNIYTFSGEKHNFWELIYVDKGNIKIIADDSSYNLKQGDAFFHKPNQFHNVDCKGKIAPNIFIISFVCNVEQLKILQDYPVNIIESEKYFLNAILNEARSAFKTPLDDYHAKNFVLNEPLDFASLQYIKIFLEAFLITVIRRLESKRENRNFSNLVNHASAHKEVFNKTKYYLENHLSVNLTLSQICKYSACSRTLLQKIFYDEVGWSVIQYYCRLKIEKAKEEIRKGYHNFSEISYSLGYSSQPYFNRQFKQITGMTPHEYKNTIYDIPNKK
jgi:AraC-like DNA-binding protein